MNGHISSLFVSLIIGHWHLWWKMFIWFNVNGVDSNIYFQHICMFDSHLICMQKKLISTQRFSQTGLLHVCTSVDESKFRHSRKMVHSFWSFDNFSSLCFFFCLSSAKITLMSFRHACETNWVIDYMHKQNKQKYRSFHRIGNDVVVEVHSNVKT